MGIIRSIAGHLRQRLSPGTIASEVGAAVSRAAGQGAAEIAQALYTGSPFVPYGPTEKPLPVTQPDQGNVHGTGPGQQQAAQPVQAPRPPSNAQMDWSSYGGSGKGGNTHESHASIYYTQPQQSHAERLQQQAARMADKPRGEERGR